MRKKETERIENIPERTETQKQQYVRFTSVTRRIKHQIKLKE